MLYVNIRTYICIGIYFLHWQTIIIYIRICSRCTLDVRFRINVLLSLVLIIDRALVWNIQCAHKSIAAVAAAGRSPLYYFLLGDLELIKCTTSPGIFESIAELLSILGAYSRGININEHYPEDDAEGLLPRPEKRDLLTSNLYARTKE